MVELFIDPASCNVPQLAFLTVVYGVILYQSSNLIASGSELLLLFPAVAGIVGSIVLPILGAVPDGLMVLFSGLGPDAQNQVSVGVGALAGSTVMLLTFPWFIAVVFGKVPMKDGVPQYGQRDGDDEVGLFSGGIQFSDSLQKSARIMLVTTLLFLVIQIPASFEESETGTGPASTRKQAIAENIFAILGLLCCIGFFIGYLYICYLDANEDKVLAKVIEGIKKKYISISAALNFVKDNSDVTPGKETLLSSKDEAFFKKVVRPFFAIYDMDGDHNLDSSEFKSLLADLGEQASEKSRQMFKEHDKDGDGQLTFEEVVPFLRTYLEGERLQKAKNAGKMVVKEKRYMPAYEQDEEEEEMPEDLAQLTPEQQRKKLMIRSCWMMGFGTFMVVIFSDPMVDVLSEWGTVLGISPFYISFVLAPFASNASELLSAYTYAKKKSQKSMTTSLSTLVGAACMNNTFCLAVFYALVYFKSLAWQFTAETLAILLIQWIIGGLVLATNVQTTYTAIAILLCYPGCLFIVWFLENIAGLD